MPKRRRKKATNGRAARLVALAIFAGILAILVVATFNMSQNADEEGVEATRQAVERATVVCYATEGFYPPALSYLEEHYGLQIDYRRYAVRYEIFAPNIAPSISVVPRSK